MPKPYTLTLPPQIRVLVVVEGGVVREVRANSADVSVEILDWDNIKAGDKWHRMVSRNNIAIRAASLFPHSIW